jgi:hypothetical protein
MDHPYFNILNSTDPLFHSLVLSKLQEIQENKGETTSSTEDITQDDELHILRRYCVSIGTEFRVLRSVLLDNMEVCTRSVRLKTSIK